MSMEERGVNEKNIRKMAVELDRMSRAVSSEEADLLDRVLVKIRDKRAITQDEADEVSAMYQRYLGRPDEDPESENEEEVAPDEYEFDGE